MSGRVIDSNGQPVDQISVSVTVTTSDDHGAEIITVFTDEAGAFTMPAPVSGINFEEPPVTVRKKGYEQISVSTEFTGNFEALFVTLVVNAVSNQVDDTTSHGYGVPLLSTPSTVTREYSTRRPNTGSEALLLGTPPRLWVSVGGTEETDIALDLETGQSRIYEFPAQAPFPMAPQTLQRDAVGNLWVASYLNKFVGLFDPEREEWIRKWHLKSETGNPIAVDSLGVGHKREVLADNQGRVWFSDMSSNSLGCFLPGTGDTEIFPVAEIAGRESVKNKNSVDLVMSSDGKQVWFRQPESGVLVEINTETHALKTVSLQGALDGPSRIAISDEDVLLVPLSGTGQLLGYDTRTGEQTIYDLPDRTSAPQVTTFDPIRKVVWIATANGGLIYRFDPRNLEFAVLPLPRETVQPRTIAVDPVSGMLVVSYIDDRAKAQGLGMALIIDPGDGVFQARRADQVEEKADVK
jgi:streptogramin lyase